jgi:hypothetical protein
MANPTLTVPKTQDEGPYTSQGFSYYAYDFLSGRFLGQVPLRSVSFGQQLNTPGSMSATIDLEDPRLVVTNPLSCTVPNRTFIVVDYLGSIMWGGVVMTRQWNAESSGSSTTRLLEIQCNELWAYFQQRVQATDYSSPPASGIEAKMSLWTATPWDASLIACQIIEDAIGFADSASIVAGNPLNGLTVLLNGATPSTPVIPVPDYIAVSYPFTSMQTVDSIVTQLSQLGLGVGFDFGVDLAYTTGIASAPLGTVNLSYPRRGRTAAQNNLRLDLTTATGYKFPEDGSQTANQIYETGGSGAISVSLNINPINQGYPIWERVISHASAQSQELIKLLKQLGEADLTTYSYAPVTPTVTISTFDPNLPIGSYIVGDDVMLTLPAEGANEQVYDARFPAGLEQEWRILSWRCDVKDEGQALTTFTLVQPPATEVLAPAV